MASAEPPRTLMDFWLDAQRQTWQRLYGMADDQGAPSLPQMIAQWQQAATQSFTAWMAGADPFVQVMTRQLMSVQTAMLQVLESTMRTWQDLAPRLAAGENQTRVLREAAESLRRQFFPEPATVAQALKESGELWRLYLEEMQRLARPWTEALRQASDGSSGEQRSAHVDCPVLGRLRTLGGASGRESADGLHAGTGREAAARLRCLG